MFSMKINDRLFLSFFLILSNFTLQEYQNVEQRNMIVLGKELKLFTKFSNPGYQNNFQLLPSNKLFVKSQPSQMKLERTQHFGKRFLSSDTKYLIRDVSVASNSKIHDNYVSQQFKWSNR